MMKKYNFFKDYIYPIIIICRWSTLSSILWWE